MPSHPTSQGDAVVRGVRASAPARGIVHIETLESQKADFRVEWSFAGTKHFISQNEQFALNRAWLMGLFAAMSAENRDAIVKNLRALKIG